MCRGRAAVLMPLAVLLIEPRGRRWFVIAALTAIGAALAAHVFYGVVAFETTVAVERPSLAYRNPATTQIWVATRLRDRVLLRPARLDASRRRVVRLAQRDRRHRHPPRQAMVWCAYAALASIILYRQLSNRHIDLIRPNSVLDGLRARI